MIESGLWAGAMDRPTSRHEVPAGRRLVRRPRLLAGLWATALFCLFAAIPAGAQTVTSADIDGVVELFTSQGCSSCPPADAVLSSFARQERVLALSYHVDYWDYIGWADPLGSRQNTERQRAYGKAMGGRTVFTPQMIVNGSRDVVGSDRRQVEAALDEARLGPGERAGLVRLTRDGSTLRVFAEAPRAPVGVQTVLILVTYRGDTVTRVARGENEGYDLVNSHSVREWQVVGKMTGKPMEIDMPVATLSDPEGGRTGCAAFLQTMDESGKPGPIVAAAMMSLEP